MKKMMVYKEVIDRVIYDLNNIKTLCKDPDTKDQLEVVIKFINQNITTNEIDLKNTLKRLIYKRMAACKYSNREKSLELYKLYQRLKNNYIETNKVIFEIEKIENKYKSLD